MHDDDEPPERAEQLPLFPRPKHGRRAEPPAPSDGAPLPPPPPSVEPADEHQADLFAAPNILREQIERAIAAADFDEAARLRDELANEHGFSWVPRDLAFLDDLIPCSWDPPDLTAVIAGWRQAETRLATPGRRRQVAEALFGRLAAMHLEDDVVRCDAACLTDMLRAMWSERRADDARLFLRDALLRDLEPDPEAIDDEVVRDVLREPRAPRWLASLGVRKGAWKAPSMSAYELMVWERSLAEPLPAEDGDRARAYWDCLRVAAMRGTVPEPLVHAARQQMKALDSEL